MKIKNSYILLLILFTGSLLRLLFINEIPFTHDEFSALSRLHFNSFSELVANGIIIDGHPAGVQVFLYYWVKIFGWTEIAVKMPFIIMGILSLWLIYKIGKFWYNETIGLVTAAFMATMQFTIMYSQIARPYGSGLFICLAMVYYWSQLVFNAEKKYWLHFALYVLFSALAAYNHHFSLLFAAIVGFTGLFFVRERQLLYYVLSGIAIFVLYIPHLNIFFYQLSVGTGGIEGWLDKPHSDFLFNFLGYLFHYSYLIYAVVIGLIVMGINQSEWSKKHTKLLLVFLAWFILPMVIGYVYSKYIAAVLQASMLIFSFPYLFFILFGHLKNQTPGMNATLVLVIMVLNISVLVLNRQHFYFVTHSPYEQILKEHDLAQKKYAGNVTSLIDSHHEISDYYIKRDNIPTNFSWSDSIGSIYDLGLFLKEQQSKNEYLYFGALTESNPVLVNIIMGYFPELVWQKNYSGGTAYLFSRAQKVPKDSIFLSVQDFEKNEDRWEALPSSLICDTISYSGKHSLRLDSTQEYATKFTTAIKEIIRNENNFIDISLKVRFDGDNMQDVMLVSSMDEGKDPIDWRSAQFSDFYRNDTLCRGKWISVYHTIKLSDIYYSKLRTMLSIYIWNKSRKAFYIDDFEIRTRRGNPYIYGLFEKI